MSFSELLLNFQKGVSTSSLDLLANYGVVLGTIIITIYLVKGKEMLI